MGEFENRAIAQMNEQCNPADQPKGLAPGVVLVPRDNCGHQTHVTIIDPEQTAPWLRERLQDLDATARSDALGDCIDNNRGPRTDNTTHQIEKILSALGMDGGDQ